MTGWKSLALAGLAVLCLGIVALLATGGCGLLTAPVSVPAAIAENANFSLHSTVVDESGKPLDGVLLTQQLNHHFWTPVAGGTDTDERKFRHIDSAFRVDERGSNLHLVFAKDGFLESKLDFLASDHKSIRTAYGRWPGAKDFPVVMLSAGGDAPLVSRLFDISLIGYPAQDMIATTEIAGLPGDVSARPTARRSGSAEDVANLPPGLLYITLTKEPPRTLNTKGDIDPAEYNLPSNFTLHLSGPDAGFVRIAPRPGYPPLQTSDTAPEQGYSPTFAIARDRLKQMRGSNLDLIIERYEYFYFRAGGHHGKGLITWTNQLNESSTALPGLRFSIRLSIQPTAGDRSLRTHGMGAGWVP